MKYREFQVINLHNGKKYAKFWMDEMGNCDGMSQREINMILNAMVIGELCVNPTGQVTDDEYDDDYESFKAS